MLHISLPGDTLSSIAARHWAELAAPDLDSGVAWLCYRNPVLLSAGGVPAGTEYFIDAYQAGAIVYA